jgi:hypothetical protein
MAVIRSTVGKGLFAIAWVGTLALALIDIGFVRSIVISIAARGQASFYSGVVIGQVTVIIGALLFLAYMIISGEYYWKHAGTARSWNLLGRTYVVLLLIPILEYFM